MKVKGLLSGIEGPAEGEAHKLIMEEIRGLMCFLQLGSRFGRRKELLGLPRMRVWKTESCRRQGGKKIDHL